MVFKIAVCIKQVPDTNDIKWTENNTIQRDGLDSVINPYDIGAIQLAKNVKFMCDEAEITVVTMGPKQAKKALKLAIAMGCDRAFLLSDKKFSGADTLATAYTLSQFLKAEDYKLIICGQQAVDGDTAQTPSCIAEKLNIPQVTNIAALKEFNNEYSIWLKETCDYVQEIKSGYPTLIAVNISNAEILPDINGYIKAQNTQIITLTADDLMADSNLIGLKGSPTQVKSTFRPVTVRNTILLENESAQNYAQYIIKEINQCKEKNE